MYLEGFPGGSDGKESACNAGDFGSIHGLGRSAGEENGNPLQYSCLENSLDRGAWWATVHGVAKNRTQLSNFHIWKLSVHTLLKASLQDFEHNLGSIWSECNFLAVWTFFGIGMKTDLFQSCSYSWVFQICWHIECSTLTATSFRILNTSAGIPSPPLALFVITLPKACLTSHSRMSGSRWWPHHRGYPSH